MTRHTDLDVAVLTRGTARGADYRWTPAAPSLGQRPAWTRLTSVQEPSLLCEVRKGVVTLELTGLVTGRRDDVGTKIVNSLGITCDLSTARQFVPGVVRIWLDMAVGRVTEAVSALLDLADNVELDLSPEAGFSEALFVLASEANPPEASGAGLVASSWLGDVSVPDHQESFLRELRSMLDKGEGTLGVMNLVASPDEVTEVMEEPAGKLVVLGVDTEALDGAIRPLRWTPAQAAPPEGDVNPGKARGREPLGYRLPSRTLVGLSAVFITALVGWLWVRALR